MKRVVLAVLLVCTLAAFSYARLTRGWTHQELLDESDFVGLVEPLSNTPNKDVFTIEVNDGHKVNYRGINTLFRVDLVFKSRGKPDDKLTVLHFTDEGAEPVANGPSFIYFPIGPLDYEKRFVKKDGEELGKMTVHAGEPLLIAFLKRRSDGRYEPVTGQEDADSSFYEVHRPFLPPP
jgi:hypothetical protein